MVYLSFQVETNYDYLRMYDGNSSNGNLLAALTGYQIPANVASCGNQMHVVFSSDNSVAKSGYYANIYEYVHEDERCTYSCPCGVDEGHCESNDQCMSGLACGYDNCNPELGYGNGTNCCYDPCNGLVDMESGVLISPNYPKSYQNNLLCTSLITVQQGKIITIEFNSFNVSKKIHIERNKNDALTQYSDKYDQFICYRLR